MVQPHKGYFIEGPALRKISAGCRFCALPQPLARTFGDFITRLNDRKGFILAWSSEAGRGKKAVTKISNTFVELPGVAVRKRRTRA
jgi:hypothetical protein